MLDKFVDWAVFACACVGLTLVMGSLVPLCLMASGRTGGRPDAWFFCMFVVGAVVGVGGPALGILYQNAPWRDV